MTEEQVLEALRAAGYRLTAQRRKLVDLLLQAEAPLTAEDIHRRARAAKVEANLSTIYRNLATFCELGWLDAVPGTNGERYYQVHADDAQTMSVLCLDCGQMMAIKAAATEPFNRAVRDMGLDADTLRVTLAAHCGHVCPRKIENDR